MKIGNKLAFFIYTSGLLAFFAINTKENLNKLEEKVDPTIIQTKNVLGGSAPEKFYVTNGDTIYIEVDRKPISNRYYR